MAGWLLFQIIGFNPINSFGSSLSAHRNLVLTRDSFVNKIQNVQINITEFFVWIGPVIGIVIVLGLIWFVLRSPQAFSKNKKAFLITTGLLVVALLISGQNRGEVGRLWLFLNPLMALSAAAVLEMFPQKDFKRILIMVGIIQIWSVYFYNHSLLGVLSI